MSMTTIYRIPVGRNLFHDWMSRGLIENSLQADPELSIIVEKKGSRLFIECNKRSMVEMLIQDARHQIEPCMEPNPSWKKTCVAFIESAELVIKSNVGIAPWETR